MPLDNSCQSDILATKKADDMSSAFCYNERDIIPSRSSTRRQHGTQRLCHYVEPGHVVAGYMADTDRVGGVRACHQWSGCYSGHHRHRGRGAEPAGTLIAM